jgi:hypothetical protein
MARKRGGLAGLYDRNKGLIRTGATIGATLLGGPAAGAATGAAFRGLDREGKRGIGFDVGQGALGALEGYAMGKGTQNIQGLLTGAKTLPPAMMRVGVAGGPEAVMTGAGGAGGGTLTQRARDLFSLAQQQGGKAFGSSEILGGIAKGLYGERQAGRTEALTREKMAEERRQFDASLGLRTREADIAAAQEADRKRREDELMKARAAIRAMFGGA